MTGMFDFPFDDVVAEANARIKQGYEVFQKFTCGGCRQRLTIDTPNVFHSEGICDKCGHRTDIRVSGCNYMAMASAPARRRFGI